MNGNLYEWLRSNKIQQELIIFTVHEWEQLAFTVHEQNQMILQYGYFQDFHFILFSLSWMAISLMLGTQMRVKSAKLS
jgi:hypothetical protein